MNATREQIEARAHEIGEQYEFRTVTEVVKMYPLPEMVEVNVTLIPVSTRDLALYNGLTARGRARRS